MTTIMSTIPFQPTTLEDVEDILRHRYPDCVPEYKERRDGTDTLRVTLRTYTNTTHHFQVRDIIGDGLSSREIPL
jgi:hypothetical protein